VGNLQRQIAGIKQQLALSPAETVARFRKVEADLTELRKGAEEQATRFRKVEDGMVGLRQAVEDEAKVQQSALDQLLDLVAVEQADLTNWKESVEDRLSKLGYPGPPAA